MALDPLFSFLDYKKYLEFKIEENESVRGYKSLMADAAQCQRSFMSQVLNSHVHLTPDHALGLAEFWRLRVDATEYFLELVNYGRAATPGLRSHLLKKLKALTEKQKDEAIAIDNPQLQNSEHAATYYSHWYWSAIHMLIEIKGFQSETALAERLHMPPVLIRQALAILETMELVKKEKGAWVSTKKHLHVPPDSIFTWLHHASWRDRSNQHLRARLSNAVHFTGVYTLSHADRDKLEEMILNFISQLGDIVGPSKEEDAVCLCLDWFPV